MHQTSAWTAGIAKDTSAAAPRPARRIVLAQTVGKRTDTLGGPLQLRDGAAERFGEWKNARSPRRRPSSA